MCENEGGTWERSSLGTVPWAAGGEGRPMEVRCSRCGTGGCSGEEGGREGEHWGLQWRGGGWRDTGTEPQRNGGEAILPLTHPPPPFSHLSPPSPFPPAAKVWLLYSAVTAYLLYGCTRPKLEVSMPRKVCSMAPLPSLLHHPALSASHPAAALGLPPHSF